MLRPATPLTLLLLAAFVLLLLSVISTPIIKSIPLASFAGVDFGVFGYCQGSKCSKIEVGYDTSALYSADQTATFNINVSTRTTLSSILIVHPVAALLTLVMLILAAAAHLHAPSHSPRYLLGTFILSILTLLVTLLSFLIDVLLFVPHMAWGSYIVLAATILIAASGIVSCAMRRTLVSRKARKRRIAENAEMNGENFYNRQAATAPPPITTVSSNSASEANKLPAFATYEMSKEASGRTSDERIPLTSRMPNAGQQEESIPLQDRYGGHQMGQGQGQDQNSGYGPPQRDQYGNIIPAPAVPYGRSREQSRDSQFRNQHPGGPYRGRGGPQGPQGYRGRGGPAYPGPGRGGYGPPGRGGYGPGPNRGGMNGGPMPGGPMMRGGRGGGPPPPGYGNGYAQGSRRAPSPAGSYSSYGRRPADGQGAPQVGAGFANMPEPGAYAGYNGQDGQDQRDSLPRAESPPPLAEEIRGPQYGQAIEMDAQTGSPQQAPVGYGARFGGIRDSDGDVAGMVGLQQQKAQMANREDTMSFSSQYNEEPYVPVRQAWANNSTGRSSPMNNYAPVELPTANPVSPMTPRPIRQSGDNYYEDIDPRFATDASSTHPTPPAHDDITPPLRHSPPPIITNALPNSYASNNQPMRNPDPYQNDMLHQQNHMLPPQNNSYEDIHSGSRSPAESERSNFTSVSQRGVNPRWNPSMGPGGFGPPLNNSNLGPRRPPPSSQRNDMLLASNPDFELPGMGGARRGGAGGMKGRGGMNGGGGGMNMNGPMPGVGMVPRGPYDNSQM